MLRRHDSQPQTAKVLGLVCRRDFSPVSTGVFRYVGDRWEDYMKKSDLNNGAALMLIASLAFIGYAVVFFFRNFAGGGFELGVTTLNGITPANLDTLNPAVMHYIMHLHIATAGFIAATGIAVAALSWYG